MSPRVWGGHGGHKACHALLAELLRRGSGCILCHAVLAEVFSGTPDEPATEGSPPAVRLAVPDNGADEAGTPRSYDPSRRCALTPSNLTSFLSFCYCQELGSAVVSFTAWYGWCTSQVSWGCLQWHPALLSLIPATMLLQGPLGRLLEVGEALGSPTLPAAVDKHLTAELLQVGWGHAHEPGAVGAASCGEHVLARLDGQHGAVRPGMGGSGWRAHFRCFPLDPMQGRQQDLGGAAGLATKYRWAGQWRQFWGRPVHLTRLLLGIMSRGGMAAAFPTGWLLLATGRSVAAKVTTVCPNPPSFPPRLVQSMGVILPLLSHRKPGSRRGSFSEQDWEQVGQWRAEACRRHALRGQVLSHVMPASGSTRCGATIAVAKAMPGRPSTTTPLQAFDRLDAQCKRMAFTLARETPEERQEQGIGELGEGLLLPSGWHLVTWQNRNGCIVPKWHALNMALPSPNPEITAPLQPVETGHAAAYCAEALEDSGWAGRRGTGAQGTPSPGRGGMDDILRGW